MNQGTHGRERGDKAAATVDPMVLASALDHIAKTAERSRSQTRRLRWIAMRANFALEGREYRDIDVDLPKDAGPETPEKLGRKLAHAARTRHEFREAVEALLEHQDALDNREYMGINGEDYEVLMRRRNAARDDLDALMAKVGSAA